MNKAGLHVFTKILSGKKMRNAIDQISDYEKKTKEEEKKRRESEVWANNPKRSLLKKKSKKYALKGGKNRKKGKSIQTKDKREPEL